MPFDRSEAWRALGLTILGLAVILAAMIAMRDAALSRPSEDYAKSPPEIRVWFKNQHNSNGEWCCDESDGHPFFGDYKLNEDGSVTLETGAGPWTLPAYMVLKGPNPTGQAVWWFTNAGGKHRDYCFAPGSLT